VEAARRGAEAFANSSMHGIFVSASGMWLHDPVAVLKAMSGEQFVSALVALTEPAYDASARTLTFRVRTLQGAPKKKKKKKQLLRDCCCWKGLP